MAWFMAARAEASGIHRFAAGDEETEEAAKGEGRKTDFHEILVWAQIRGNPFGQTVLGFNLNLIEQREKIPLFVVGDGLAGLEGDQLAEGLDLEHLAVGEGLEIATAVGILRAGVVVEGLDEQAVVQEIGDPFFPMGEPEFGRWGNPRPGAGARISARR